MANLGRKTNSAAVGAVTVNQLLAEERGKPANCFRLRYAGGIEEGFYLRLNQPKSGVSGGVYKPHLAVGHTFMNRDTSLDGGCAYRETPEGGHVRRAVVKTVSPYNSSTSFEVLSRPKDENPSPLLFVDSGMGGRCTLKTTVAGLIWSGVVGTASVIKTSATEALVRFDTDEEQLHVLHPDGTVRRVIRTDGRLALDQALTPAAMARVRVELARSHLRKCDGSAEQRSRILSGLVPVASLALKYPDAAWVFQSFFREQMGVGTGNALADAILRRLAA